MSDIADMLRYGEAGCELASPFLLFAAVYQLSGGKPCEGCAYDAHSQRCAARRLLFPPTPKHVAPVVPAETVRAEAERLGISISEVRRRRKAA